MKLGLVAAALAACVLVVPAHADHPDKGNSIVWLGVHGDRAQLTVESASGFFEYGEVGVDAAFNHFVTDHWTVVLSGDVSGSSVSFDATGGAQAKSTGTSWDVRFGGDRWAFINDDVAIYAGPSVRYWQGHVTDDDGAGTKITGPDVKQIALNGRMGFWTRLGSHYGLYGHIGQVIGYNTSDLDTGRLKWWSSHHEGSVGLAFDF